MNFSSIKNYLGLDSMIRKNKPKVKLQIDVKLVNLVHNKSAIEVDPEKRLEHKLEKHTQKQLRRKRVDSKPQKSSPPANTPCPNQVPLKHTGHRTKLRTSRKKSPTKCSAKYLEEEGYGTNCFKVDSPSYDEEVLNGSLRSNSSPRYDEQVLPGSLRSTPSLLSNEVDLNPIVPGLFPQMDINDSRQFMPFDMLPLDPSYSIESN